MATPIISAPTVVPAKGVPAEPVSWKVNATDPDSRTLQVLQEVTDKGGAKGTRTDPLRMEEPLTYKVTVNDPNAIVTQDPTAPSDWTILVPSLP